MHKLDIGDSFHHKIRNNWAKNGLRGSLTRDLRQSNFGSIDDYESHMLQDPPAIGNSLPNSRISHTIKVITNILQIIIALIKKYQCILQFEEPPQVFTVRIL